MTKHSIAHDVAVESGMARESLSALTAVIQEGIDRALTALGEPDRMETSTGERALWLAEQRRYENARYDFGAPTDNRWARLLRDFDRLLAREAKAREEERATLATQFYAKAAQNEHNDRYWAFKIAAEMCRARSKP